jgi:hypothetical protein
MIAGALDERIGTVVACRCLSRYRDLLEAPRFEHPLSAVLPDVVPEWDLPDFGAAIAPRPLWLLNPVDSMGKNADWRTVKARYRSASMVSAKLGGVCRVSVLRPAEVPTAVARWFRDFEAAYQPADDR